MFKGISSLALAQSLRRLFVDGADPAQLCREERGLRDLKTLRDFPLEIFKAKLSKAILYYIISCYITLYYIVFYCTILHYIML